jgi:hypothetical protein
MSTSKGFSALIREPPARHCFKHGLQASQAIAELGTGSLMVGHVRPDPEFRKLSNKPAE